MPLAARQATLGRPAAIAVHDDGHMARRLYPFLTLPRLLGWVGRGVGGLRHFGRSRSFGHPLSPAVEVRIENLFGVIESCLHRHARAVTPRRYAAGPRLRGYPRLSLPLPTLPRVRGRVGRGKAWMAGTSPAMTL